MSKKLKILLIILSCLMLTVICWLYYQYQEQKFEIIFFNIGQGDSALINLPGNNEILIDGGPDSTVLYKLGKYLPVYNRDIELMILSHPHADHTNGLNFVLNRYQVKQVMHTNIKYNSEKYQNFLEKTKKLNIKTLKPEKNKKINFNNNILEIIYPLQDISKKDFKDINDSSIVFRLITNKGYKILFTGDISIDIEKEILEKVKKENLTADILKVGHQGSITSSDQEFLQAVSPDYAVISVGENKFGHPSLRVLRRLQRLGTKILRTDKDGNIVFQINENGVELK